jgi:signal transduction histidine kinase
MWHRAQTQERDHLLSELRQRTDDLTESLEQQTATSEILRVISISPTDTRPVFETIVRNAVSLCGGLLANVFRYDGEFIHYATSHGPSNVKLLRAKYPMRPDLSQISGRVVLTKSVVWLEDALADPDYDQRFPKALRWRRMLGVPMLRDGKLLGVIVVAWSEPGPVSKGQEELLKTFANQAVIAIENVRLFESVQARTVELAEALERQTATSEVLQVISRSPGELAPVFDAMLENAARICEADLGTMAFHEDGSFRLVALYGAPPAYGELRLREPVVHPHAEAPLGQLSSTKQVVHVEDLLALPDHAQGGLAKIAGARTLLIVPLLKEQELLGIIGIYRQEVRPFVEKQIELVKNFAAQAVIAIENTRLLNELRERTSDLTESLQQQIATSEVLEVISRSAFDLAAVFEAIVESSAKLCGADRAIIFRFDGEVLRVAAAFNAPQTLMDWLEENPIRPGRYSVAARAGLEHRTVQVPDVMADPEHTYGAKNVEAFRTVLGVPILKGDELLGVILIYHLEVRPFTDKQIALIETFSDQAAIAIENVRLLEAEQERSRELSESLQQQTATADVLKVISRSTFDLQIVLDALVESAARLCEADTVLIGRPRGEAYYFEASHGVSSEYAEYAANHPPEMNRGTVSGRVMLERKIVQVADVLADDEYTYTAAQKMAGYRTLLGVPLLREGSPIGVIALGRNSVRPFTERQIELATTFADQAVIAIENVRLFEEIQDKSRQLEVASQHKSQFLANMSHELRTPLNAILGYTELILDNIYGETPAKMREALDRIERNGKHLLGLINDVLDLSKIEAGQLTLSIADYSLGDITHAVYSALAPLAAQKKLRFEVEVSPDLPTGCGDEHRLRQVLLNLVGNAIKFTDSGEVLIKAAAADASFTVAVHDTGPGISVADQAKLFQEFQQADNSITRKKGGTGLGLAISKRIIDLHGGKIWVESVVGKGSKFVFTFPVVVEP